MMEIEELTAYLLPTPGGSRTRRKREKRLELINLIEDFFGEEDAKLVLMIALYFKYPEKYSRLEKEIRKLMELQPS